MALALPPGAPKFAFTVHLTSSLGWIGAVMVYPALGLSILVIRESTSPAS